MGSNKTIRKSARRQRTKLCKKHNYRCQNCGCTVVEKNTIKRERREVLVENDSFIIYVKNKKVIFAQIATTEHLTPPHIGHNSDVTLFCFQCNNIKASIKNAETRTSIKVNEEVKEFINKRVKVA